MDPTEFKSALARDGFTEVLTREMRLDRGGASQTLCSGDWCEVPHNMLHAEHYGPAGTSLLVGRRYPPS